MPSGPDGAARGARDTAFVAGAIVVAFLVTVLPDIIGHARATSARAYIGPFTPDDEINLYYSFIAQARDGAWLFENRLTTIAHPARWLNLQWLAVGLVARVTGGSNEAVNHVWHLAGVTLLLSGFWRLAAHVVTGTWPRRIALIVFATGAGFGWAFLVLRQFGIALPWDYFYWPSRFRSAPYDIYAGTTFRVLAGGYHATSYGLLLLGLERFIAGERRGSRGAYAACAAIALTLALSHPYEAMTLAGTVVAVILVSARLTIAAARPLALRALPVVAAALGFAYWVLLFARYPIYRWGTTVPSPPHLPLHTLVVLGFAGLLALWGLRAFLARAATGDPAYLVIAAALAANVALYYSFPVLGFSSVFRTTLMAPVLLIALASLEPWWPRLTHTLGGVALLVVLTVVNIGSNAVGFGRQIANAGNPAGAAYVDGGLVELGRWLERHRAVGDAALASPALGMWLPAHAGVRVYAGYVVLTPGSSRRAEDVSAFFALEASEAERVRFLRTNRVRWVVVTPAEKDFAPGAGALAQRFEAGGYRVYEVEP